MLQRCGKIPCSSLELLSGSVYARTWSWPPVEGGSFVFRTSRNGDDPLILAVEGARFFGTCNEEGGERTFAELGRSCSSRGGCIGGNPGLAPRIESDDRCTVGGRCFLSVTALLLERFRC